MYATEGDAVAAEGQDILALEGALLRPHAGLPQLLQARHVENVGDGRVPLQGARDSLKEKSENAITQRCSFISTLILPKDYVFRFRS